MWIKFNPDLRWKRPGTPQRHPELMLPGCKAVLQEFTGLGRHERGDHASSQLRSLAALDDELEGYEEEVDQLGGVGVVDVGLQFGLTWEESCKGNLVSDIINTYRQTLKDNRKHL